jgi:hypothetical protein
MSGRGILIIVLTALIPPVGLLLLWRQGAFRARGRMVITALATLEMMLLGVLLTPRQELTAQMPQPAAPVAVTQAPAEENLSALYNIEELLYQEQLAQVVAAGGDETDIMSDAQKDAAREAEREQVLNTTVYAVFRNAQRYHAQMVCGTQSNGRALTVREAMLEALSPCPDCNPPVWTE